MKKKVKIIASVNHDGNILKLHENYDMDADVADSLIKLGCAESVEQDAPARPQPEPQGPQTPKYDAKTQGFVAQAKLTQEELDKIKAEGKEDNTPITGSKEVDTSPEPTVAPAVVDSETGKPLSDEQIRANEQAAATSAAAKDATDPSLNAPTA